MVEVRVADEHEIGRFHLRRGQPDRSKTRQFGDQLPGQLPAGAPDDVPRPGRVEQARACGADRYFFAPPPPAPAAACAEG